MSVIQYEVRDRVAVVTLNRPEAGNAQTFDMLEDLDHAFAQAVADDEVRVIILRAEGKHFSTGHDISGASSQTARVQNMFADVPNTGLLRMYDWESKHYFGYSRRWRDIPKPTIAVVQGACVAAGLMLCWPMDIIIASEDARFSDPVARMGIGGVEYHGHGWEWGARKAKEMLFTGAWMDAREAHRLGMVNRVVPRDQLDETALSLAGEIAQMHPHGVRMAKRSINAMLDAQGQHQALDFGFQTHSLGHANAWIVNGWPIMANLDEMKAKGKEAT